MDDLHDHRSGIINRQQPWHIHPLQKPTDVVRSASIEEMKRLFELGYEMGSAGSAWRDTPPGYLLEQ